MDGRGGHSTLQFQLLLPAHHGADLPYQAPEHNAGHSSFPLPGPGLSLNYSLILGKEEWGREGPGKGFVAREAAVRARGPHWRLAL